MATSFRLIWVGIFGLLCGITVTAQTDKQHYSRVFQREKEYRIYLPSTYQQQSDKRFPVVYYFHGNKGDHKLRFDGVQQLVEKANIILVCWNGRSVNTDDRPYNNGYHSNINYPYQFHEYFVELVNHIDSTYRTVNDRGSRGIIGHSMGGFMAYFLAGKYPHLVSAVVNSKGSPEFFVGKPDNHTLIQHRYLFKNLQGLRVRFQNGTLGEELVHLNEEVHQASFRETGLNYSYQEYEGGHTFTFDQFKDAFEYITNTLREPTTAPTRWHHADIYPQFSVWNYEVNSTLNEPGFVELKGVTKGGFTTLTRKWQPDGIQVKGVTMQVKTAPIYQPSSNYTLLDYNSNTGASQTKEVHSDATGRITVSADHQTHIFGIFSKTSPAELAAVNYTSKDKTKFLEHKKPTPLHLRILNRGGRAAEKISVTLSSPEQGVTIKNPVIRLQTLASAQAIELPEAFMVQIDKAPPSNGGTPYIRFNVLFTDGKGNQWQDEFDALVMYDVPEFSEVGIDDGDSEIFGSGNGNNIAEPGETIMIYQVSHRTKLYYDDPYIETERLHDDLQPDKWGDGYALSSLIKISKDCPPGHVIRFLACYEVKEWKTIKRIVTWGRFSITIGNKKPAADEPND